MRKIIVIAAVSVAVVLAVAVSADEGTGEPTPQMSRGAVLSVMTVVGPTAPAATQDLLSFIRVTISSDATAQQQIDIPVGGSVVLGRVRFEPVIQRRASLTEHQARRRNGRFKGPGLLMCEERGL